MGFLQVQGSLQGIPLQKGHQAPVGAPPSTPVIAPGTICPEWGEANLGVDAIINK